jgi:predicted O-methyltransferase YrrM
MTLATLTAADYAAVFERERNRVYPQIDMLEHMCDARLERGRLEAAARVLACPVKVHAPCWQHGRLLYAVTHLRLRALESGSVTLLDIGTAKGFSALCLQWALIDAGADGHVISLDVVNPYERVRRNTIAELDGLKTVLECLEPWPEARAIEFVQADARLWLTRNPGRLAVAFVDGKHTYEAVSWELALLSNRQQCGDLIVIDDLQIAGVRKAVGELEGYHINFFEGHADRRYAVAERQP